MFKVNNKNTRTTSMTLFWCFIVNFEQVNVRWAISFEISVIYLGFHDRFQKQVCPYAWHSEIVRCKDYWYSRQAWKTSGGCSCSRSNFQTGSSLEITHFAREASQVTCICSNSTIETLEKVWTMFKVNNKSTRMTSLTLFWCFYC